jgi:hypothetical protein
VDPSYSIINVVTGMSWRRIDVKKDPKEGSAGEELSRFNRM